MINGLVKKIGRIWEVLMDGTPADKIDNKHTRILARGIMAGAGTLMIFVVIGIPVVMTYFLWEAGIFGKIVTVVFGGVGILYFIGALTEHEPSTKRRLKGGKKQIGKEQKRNT